MAREYFCAYHSYLQTIEELSLEERGMLFTACLMYSETGETPALSGFAKAVFPGIRAQIDRDRIAFENRCKTQADNANKRWHANESQPMPRHATACNGMPIDAKHAKEKDKEIEKDTEIENVKERNSPTESKERKPKDDLDTAVDYFKEHRKKLKKPMTDHAVDLFRKRLEKLAPGDVTKKIELIDYAIVKGWQDVYIPDESGNQTSKTPEPKKTPKPRTFVLTEDGGLKYDDEP